MNINDLAQKIYQQNVERGYLIRRAFNRWGHLLERRQWPRS